MKQKALQFVLEWSSRTQEFQVGRQPIPSTGCGDRESSVTNLPTRSWYDQAAVTWWTQRGNLFLHRLIIFLMATGYSSLLSVCLSVCSGASLPQPLNGFGWNFAPWRRSVSTLRLVATAPGVHAEEPKMYRGRVLHWPNCVANFVLLFMTLFPYNQSVHTCASCFCNFFTVNQKTDELLLHWSPVL